MKKVLTFMFLGLLAAASVSAQDKMHTHKPMTNAERKSPHDTVKADHMTISYGRPYKKGRDIFGSLEGYGKVWRLGADEATEITIDRGCNFGGKKLPAGTYTLFAIPGKTEWEIIVNGVLGQWGAFSYDKNKDKDVLHTNVPVKNLGNAVEQFTISIKKNGIQMEWDKTSVFVPVKF
jgi:hypothetical protein